MAETVEVRPPVEVAEDCPLTSAVLARKIAKALDGRKLERAIGRFWLLQRRQILSNGGR